jgi:NADPH-dependent glutamate synthase beta subunit-like oxidoreductase
MQKIQWNISYNPNKLKKSFTSFLKKNKLTNNKLDIIQTAKNLELFIYQNFEISHNLNNCNEESIEIKKNFIQRTVFQKYKNSEIPESWENYYNFINEEKFIQEAINKKNLENLEKYSAFAIFTKKGKIKHKNDTIFHLPKNINQKDDFIQIENNLVKSSQTNNIKYTFDITDTFPTKNTIDWNLSYCLYCHNRNKDSCSKGLNEEKQGCPLNQDISESIFLKRNNYHIASLAVIMKENPLCILTGRRICQNCEEACIFQKQEPVDIQSIESQILFDVLNMEYGLEVYNLLLWWNPFLEYKKELNGKSVLIAGLGPAGLFTSYLLSNYGANVLGIDALTIEIPEKIKKISTSVIKHAQEFLNQPLSQRIPSGIGGVMEYGITVRWNKNLIDILVGLLMRRKNIEFQGSIRLGGLLNYDDIQNFGFNHTAICIGSATPQVPKIEGIFHKYSLTQGVIMASDFLMSLHLNRASSFLNSITNPPVYILGCGLTAIDVACQVRTILVKNKKKPNVKILYYQNFEESSSYKINHFEFKQALNEGIEIIQNTKITKIKKNNHNQICEIILSNGEILPCNLLIIAIGTKPNTSHIEQFLSQKQNYTDNISLFGDCNPQYTGSVVNALSSVKENIFETISKIKKNNNIPQNYKKIFKHKIAIKEINPNFYKITIKNQFLSEKSQIGNVLKFQIPSHNSIALTISQIKNHSLILYLQNSNPETHTLIESIIQNKKIHINGINCSALPKLHPNCTIVTDDKTKIILKKIFKNHKFISINTFTSINFQKNSKIKKIFFITLNQETSNNPHLEKKIMEAQNSDIQILLYQKMNCMLGGICGRCIKPDGTYACIENNFKLQTK